VTSPQFYVLDTIQACDSRLYAGGQWVNDTRTRCPTCGVFSRATEPDEIEIGLDHLGRHGFAEYLWNSHTLPIFRRDLIDLWRGQGFTGFALKPVRIVGWSRRSRKPLPADIPDYYRVVVTSRIRLLEPPPAGVPCPSCGFVKYSFPKIGNHLPQGIAIDVESWDGSDLFGPAQYVFVFCTRRVADATLQAGYNRHIVFVRTGDYSRWEDFDIRQGWTPEKHQRHVESFLIRRIEDL